MTEQIEAGSTDGLRLEAELDRPDVLGGALLLCHPHPKMGGTMNAPLLLALRDELVARGWAVLRFNFRGIGASEGTPGSGVEEGADARGALARLRELMPDVPVAIAGWSFGAGVAIRLLDDESIIEGCVAIAPSVEDKEDVTVGLPPPGEIRTEVPIWIVCGERDEQVSPAACRRWAEAVPAAGYVELRGANHFFWGQYDKLAATVVGFLDQLL